MLTQFQALSVTTLLLSFNIRSQPFENDQLRLSIGRSLNHGELSAQASNPNSNYGPKPKRQRPGPPLLQWAPQGGTFYGPDFVNWVQFEYNRGIRELGLFPGSYKVQADAGASGHLILKDLNDFTIWMDGVNLTMTNSDQSAFVISYCSGLTLIGPTVHWDVPGFSQANITAVEHTGTSTNGKPDFKVSFHMEAGYDQSGFWRDDAHTMFSQNAQYTDPNTYQLAPGAGWSLLQGDVVPIQDAADSYTMNALGLYFIPQPGFKLLARNNKKNFFCNNIGWSNDTHIVDFTLLNCGYYGWFSGASRRTYYDSLVIKPADFPPPGGVSLPARSSSADGVHSNGDYEGPIWDSCYFEGLDDDCMAVHGRYNTVNRLNASTNVIITSASAGVVGDVLRFYTQDTYLPLGSAQLTWIDPDPSVTNRYKVDKLPAGVIPGTVVANQNQVGSGFQVFNTYTHSNRGRGILAKASNGTITNNYFSGVSYAAVQLGPDNGGGTLAYAEADYVHNVTVSNNVLVNNSYLNKANAAIHVNAASQSNPSGNSDVAIINNTIINSPTANIGIDSTENLTLRDNQFLYPLQYYVWGEYSESILAAGNVSFSDDSGGNCYSLSTDPPSRGNIVDDLGDNSVPNLASLVIKC